jgi:hypothetical protein
LRGRERERGRMGEVERGKRKNEKIGTEDGREMDLLPRINIVEMDQCRNELVRYGKRRDRVGYKREITCHSQLLLLLLITYPQPQ